MLVNKVGQKQKLTNLTSSHKYELLLKAVLLDKENYLVAFSKWKQNIDFEHDIDSDSIKLLPLLYQKLCDQKVDDDLIPRLKGIYRKSWINNQLICEQLTSLIGDLSAQKITPLILPEAASAFIIYNSLALRYIGKFNFAVKQSQLQDVIRYLYFSGWKVGKNKFDLNFIFKYGTNISFRKKNVCEITLHWYPDFDSNNNKLETDLWERSIMITQGGQELNFFSITDCFIYLIKNHLSDPINLTDISTMITFHSDKLNWDLIIAETQNINFAETLNQVLLYLKNTVEVIVPDSVYKVLSSKKKHWLEIAIENRINILNKKSNLKTKTKKINYVYLQYNAMTYQANWYLKQIGLLKYIYRNKKRKLELKQ
jgi:hypothetical protein